MVDPLSRRRFWSVDALSGRRRCALILSRLARHPATQMFEDSANDRGVIDQRDDVHWRAALGTRQRIDFVDFVNEPCPRRLGARRRDRCLDCARRSALGTRRSTRQDRISLSTRSAALAGHCRQMAPGEFPVDVWSDWTRPALAGQSMCARSFRARMQSPQESLTRSNDDTPLRPDSPVSRAWSHDRLCNKAGLGQGEAAPTNCKHFILLCYIQRRSQDCSGTYTCTT